MNPKLVLGIETSGTTTGLALAASGRVVSELVEHSSCGHNEVLMPLLDRLLKDAGATVRDLHGIGVDIGPGMFTSLRVGTSTAKGLALAHGIPVAGVSSLWALARTAQPDLNAVLSLIDARKHQVYAGLYLDGRSVIPPSVAEPEQLVSEVRSKLTEPSDLAVAGSGVSICADLLAAGGIGLALTGIDYPSPGMVAIEAEVRIEQGLADDVAAIEPVYLRRTDAELTREKKLNSGR